MYVIVIPKAVPADMLGRLLDAASLIVHSTPEDGIKVVKDSDGSVRQIADVQTAMKAVAYHIERMPK